MDHLREKEEIFVQALSAAMQELGPEGIFTFIDEYKIKADKENDWMTRWQVRGISAMFAYEDGRMDYLMAEMVWMAAHWETAPDDELIKNFKYILERYVDEVANCTALTVEQAEMLLESLERWMDKEFHTKHTLLAARMRMYEKLGRAEIAAQYKAELMELEKELPFTHSFSATHCMFCYYTACLQYNFGLGMMEDVDYIIESFFDDEDDPNVCMSSPRGGMAYLLDALLDEGKGDDPYAERAIALLHKTMDYPFKAPLRIVAPMLRYYLWKEDYEEAAALIDNNMHRAESATDTWHAWKFFDYASQHPDYDAAALKARAEALWRSLQR